MSASTHSPVLKHHFDNLEQQHSAERLGMWMFLATDTVSVRDAGSAARHLLPFQSLAQDRPALEQRMFRELQEGLLEAESTRASTGNEVASRLL